VDDEPDAARVALVAGIVEALRGNLTGEKSRPLLLHRYLSHLVVNGCTILSGEPTISQP
jgi:hypothetical protein